MSTLLLTLAAAVILIIIAISLLAIGWLITGSSRIQPGACGRDPHKQRSDKEGCGTDVTCSLCKKSDGKKKE
jgi:hypothetical protein